MQNMYEFVVGQMVWSLKKKEFSLKENQNFILFFISTFHFYKQQRNEQYLKSSQNFLFPGKNYRQGTGWKE